jgi:hypothetical protein
MEREFKILVESNDQALLSKKHKCALTAGNLEDFRKSIEHNLNSIQGFNLPPGLSLKLECWDDEFDEYIGEQISSNHKDNLKRFQRCLVIADY